MALEPLVFFEEISTTNSFTRLAAADRFNLNVDDTELEFPSRNTSIPILYAGSADGSGDIEEARTDIPSLREPSDIYVGQVNDDVQPGGYFFPHQDNSLNPLPAGRSPGHGGRGAGSRRRDARGLCRRPHGV